MTGEKLEKRTNRRGTGLEVVGARVLRERIKDNDLLEFIQLRELSNPSRIMYIIDLLAVRLGRIDVTCMHCHATDGY